MTLAIGLTGGIGSGKTTVCDLFSELSVPVLDADQIARDLVRKGSPLLDQIAARFGSVLLTADGTLDRQALRRQVFADPRQKQALEALLHPPIKAALREAVKRIDAPYCVLCIPLLLEVGWTDLVRRIAVVDSPEDLQRQRTMARDGLTASEVEAIMRAQTSRQDRLARADDVLTNDKDIEHLRRQVWALHAKYLELAKQTQPAARRR